LSIGPGAYATECSDDGVSTRSLNGLVRVHKQGDVVDVSDWEDREADGGLVVMLGMAG
jgi:3,4-dihydroxy-2-butanone 4-phosphate synthase